MVSNVITVGSVTYHLNPRLKAHWERHSIAQMKKSNSDRVYIVDGMERSGKSYFTFQQMGALCPEAFKDTETFLKRVCFSPEDFFEAIRTLKNTVIVFDEAFRGFSSRSALSRVNKKLNQGLMEMGQNNNIVFIVLPRIFLLDVYPAMLRSHGLFNITIAKKAGKRIFRGYNASDKNQIYQIGSKKGWRYPIKSRFRGPFYNKFPGGQEFEDAYLDKKGRAFRDMDLNEKGGIVSGETMTKEQKFKLQRDLLISYNYRINGSFAKLEKAIGLFGLELKSTELKAIYKETLPLLDESAVAELKTKGFVGKAAKILADSEKFYENRRKMLENPVKVVG